MKDKYKPTDCSEEACLYRARKYDCDGCCYKDGICPAVDTCPATAGLEFRATLVAGLIYLAIVASPFILILYVIIKIFK